MINSNAWNRTRYSALAPLYDTVAGFSTQRRRAITMLAPEDSEQVLIVGAGTGLDLLFLPTNMSVTAVDLTPAMVRRTRQRAAQGHQRVSVAVMDGQQLALPTAYFDAVLLHLILAVIPDPFATIAEATRVLKRGGRVLIFDKFLPDEQQPSPLRRALNLATRTLFSDINRQLGPLLASAGLQVADQEPAGFGGAFKIVLARKGG
jgi:phosphatidylethanolamine/phosphatidyl-N-methylethanolamine N-methyltransferase